METTLGQKKHRFDVSIGQTNSWDLIVEEVPENTQLWSDCALCGTTFSTTTTSSTLGSLFCVGSVISTKGD